MYRMFKRTAFVWNKIFTFIFDHLMCPYWIKVLILILNIKKMNVGVKLINQNIYKNPLQY